MLYRCNYKIPKLCMLLTLLRETHTDTSYSVCLFLSMSAIFVHLRTYAVHGMLLSMIIIRLEYRKPLVATDRSAAIRAN